MGLNIGIQLRAVVVDEILAPLPRDCIQRSDIQKRIDRIYPKLLNLGHQDPQAIKWTILQKYDDITTSNGWEIEAQMTLMRVLNEVDISGEILLSIALDKHVHQFDRANAMEYLASRKQKHLVEPLRDLFIKPYEGEIRAAALDALAQCGIQDILPIVQELYRYRAIAEERTPWSDDTDISLPRALWLCIVNWFREGVAIPEDWHDPWSKLLKARGQLGDITALRDLIILLDDPHNWSDGAEGLDALIRHMGGLEHAVAELSKESLFETFEDRLLELACHDTEGAVSNWANYQLAVMNPHKYAERSQEFLNQRADAWIRKNFQEWLLSMDDDFSEVQNGFFHPDKSVMALTAGHAVGLFRRSSRVPFYSWSPPEETIINYLDFHESKSLLLIATGIQCNYETEGQIYLVDYENNSAKPLLEESWEVAACWFLMEDLCRVIFGAKYETDENVYQADLQIKKAPMQVDKIGPMQIYPHTAWETERYKKTGTEQAFEKW